MSKTNDQVIEAFGQGKEAKNGRHSLASEQRLDADGNDYTFLQSYQSTIAIRRAKDEAIFHDAHRYSVTTTRHQSGHYGSPEFSFDCVAELMGANWYETARIIDWGPRNSSNPEC